MAEDYGIKISKAGTDVKGVPTATTKKNFIILSTDSVHKVSAQAVVSADTNIAHGLGFAPICDVYGISDNGTKAHPPRATYDSTYLYLTATEAEPRFYIIYLDQP